MNKNRYFILDALRGFALLHMIIYHAIWDIVYVFGADWDWYKSYGAYIWQQWICWTFILLSGFCFAFGKPRYKRGVIVFLCGFAITMVTLLAMPENIVLFGVLTLIGSSTLLLTPCKELLAKVNPYLGTTLSFSLFFITRNVNHGHLGFEKLFFADLPDSIYHNMFTAYLGFPNNGFYSTDYFAIFPWIFLFLTGFFLNHLCSKKKILNLFEPHICRPLEWLGKYSLQIYILHQPIIYGLLTIFFSLK